MGRSGSRHPVRITVGLAAVSVVTVTLTGCGSDRGPVTAGAAIVLASPAAPATTLPATPPATPPPPGTPVIDRRAELDIDDQAGDGRRVRVRAVRTSLPMARLVIMDARGAVLGSDVVTPGVQVVTVRLDRPVRASGELVARLVTGTPERMAPIHDGDGEPEEEDFDYRLE